MYFYQNKRYSSFLSVNDHPQGISDAFQFLTVRSGSAVIGKNHVSMYLEMTDPLDGFRVTTYIIELIAVKGHPLPIIKIKRLQTSNLRGQLTMDKLDKKRGPAELLKTHHATYILDSTESARVLEAAGRFREKSDRGEDSRYRYRSGGGIKARVASKPGTRNVNCGDFLIKILREAEIAKLKYKYLSTPYRVASRHKQLQVYSDQSLLNPLQLEQRHLVRGDFSKLNVALSPSYFTNKVRLGILINFDQPQPSRCGFLLPHLHCFPL